MYIRRAAAIIDVRAMEHNIAEVCARLPSECGVMAVVKANAYGHGAALVAPCLFEQGIDRFAVASLDEGIALRSSMPRGELLVLGYVPPDLALEAADRDITLAVCDLSHVRALAAHAKTSRRSLKVHIAVDTGMSRVGVSPDECADAVEMCESNSIRVDGIFSHLCTAGSSDQSDVEFVHAQAERFRRALDGARSRCAWGGAAHLLASSAAINYPEYAHDFVRLGITMYGAPTSRGDYERVRLDLRPVMTFAARVASVRKIRAGESVGYGRTFTADRDTTVATIAAGYADGIPRALSGGHLRAIVRGEFAYGIGRVCMDQTMIDVTGIDGVEAGDVATLIGSSGGREIRADELAESVGTITHDIFCGIGERVERMLAC